MCCFRTFKLDENEALFLFLDQLLVSKEARQCVIEMGGADLEKAERVIKAISNTDALLMKMNDILGQV